MSHKSEKIASIILSLQGRQFDAHYLGYFACFNQQLFFEAHEVLEELWLPQRGQANDLFYKGLIQLAGAFVHLQKNRVQPALALFKLARANLGKYAPVHEALDLIEIEKLIGSWTGRLQAGGQPLAIPALSGWPRLSLQPIAGSTDPPSPQL